jgi:glycerol-1-phosphate dehydrogenase [NAD(P)+]
MNIQFDPNDNEKFWQKVSQIPGFPKEDQIALKRMIFEPGALFQLDAVLREAGAKPEKPLLVVMDATPMRRGHEDLKELVLATLVQAGWTPEKLVLAPDQTGQVHTDMPHILAVKAHLTATTSVLSVGSGVVTDVAKHASYLFEQDNGTHVPFVVYQTANSVSAYASDMAPVFVDGVKRTLASRYPDGLVADLETLRDAPKEMTVAGVGDLLAAFISFPDWFLAQKMGFDPHYNQLPQTLMGPLDEIFLAEADGIRKGDLGSTATLARKIRRPGDPSLPLRFTQGFGFFRMTPDLIIITVILNEVKNPFLG